jgi:hypothetical protein
MAIFTQLETRIREEHENDTAREVHLGDHIGEAVALRERIMADGRIDRNDLPHLKKLFGELDGIAADHAVSLEYNRTINGMYGQLAQRRRSA